MAAGGKTGGRGAAGPGPAERGAAGPGAHGPGNSGRPDVLIVSLGSTAGLRAVDAELLASLRHAGARAEIACAERPRSMRTLVLTDLAWALAARRAAREALAREPARAVIYSTTTAALLWPRPGAIRFDSLAAANRPRRHGLWQRPLERRRLREATLLLPQSEGALAEGPGASPRRVGDEEVLVLPVPVEASGAASGAGVRSATETLSGAADVSAVREPGRDAGSDRYIAAITYAANPAKKGLDVLLAAWARVRRPGEELWVAGVAERDLRARGYEMPPEGVRVSGVLAPEEYRALLRRARVYVCAARREDYGVAQLEALADGCMLVTTPSPGPYAALPLARELDGRLVSEDIGAAMRVALDDPSPGYAERAARALAPFRREAVDRLVANELLPRLRVQPAR
jgi:glycosyltransferase involved in cell wall biosynthesis